MARNIKKELIQSPKGMHDVLPEEQVLWQKAYNKAEEIACFYGFQFIRTPHLEKLDIFTKTIGEATDIVEKQMFLLKPRGGEQLVLRPEATAPLVRAYIEHGLHTLPQPIMLYTKGAFFRYEQPQKGRFREFQHFDLEILGDEEAISDAVIIKVVTVILEELGLKPLTVHVNSIGDPECRHVYRKELAGYYRKKVNYLCKDCKRRLKTNPPRLLDCKEEKCIELKQNAPQMINYLCGACKNHFKQVLEFLDANNISYILDHYLVRGLDYYSRTVFEVFLQEEDKDNDTSFALLGGGRYDFLGDVLAGRHIPAVGAAIGMERIIALLKKKELISKKDKKLKVALIQIGAAAKSKSLVLIEEFRKAKIPLFQSLSKDSLKGQLSVANKLKVSYALILGQKEALDNTIIVRDMDSGAQETISQEKVIDYLKKKL